MYAGTHCGIAAWALAGTGAAAKCGHHIVTHHGHHFVALRGFSPRTVLRQLPSDPIRVITDLFRSLFHR